MAEPASICAGVTKTARRQLFDRTRTLLITSIQAGVHPKIVQERLGPFTISITLDIYSQVNPAMDADAANTVAA